MSKKGVWTIHFLLWLDMLSSNDGCECIFNVGLPIHGNNHPHIQRYFYFILVQLSLVCLLFIKLPLWLPGSIGASWCDQFNPLQTSEISVVTLSAFTKKSKYQNESFFLSWRVLEGAESAYFCDLGHSWSMRGKITDMPCICIMPWNQNIRKAWHFPPFWRKTYRNALYQSINVLTLTFCENDGGSSRVWKVVPNIAWSANST